MNRQVVLGWVEGLKGQPHFLIVGVRGSQPQPLGNAVHVGVYGKGRFSGAEEEDDVGGF